MLRGLLSKVVGDSNEKQVRKLEPLVEAINALEPDLERRTDAQLRALTGQFRARLAAGETLDDLLPEAFAAVREAAKRTVDMRPFDVQLIGGIVLHQGKVAEMKTGEGKTLVATMPIYLNALLGRGAHLVTVNDYLARRDTLWMGPVYHLLGLSIGLLQSGFEQPAYLYDPNYQRDPYPGLRPVPRSMAYAADITYGTNNEFGFDYLRDNLALSLGHRVQRSLYYAIVDEVDNIFIDEARTPLIISSPSGEPVEEYSRFAAIARRLEPGVHYELDEKERTVFLTDEGLAVVEQETGIENIYDEANYRYVHYMQQALKAQVLYLEGRDYIRQRKQIVLVDYHTGRLMPDRRLSEGLHQAIEAKEGVSIRPRDVTSATITIQNYFRMYEKLAGMSGTALTEAEEFFKIYKLDVLAIPTNKPMIRRDHPDVVYRSEEAKLRAVAREILSCHSRGQPVLVGTTSVEMSERLSTRLTGDRLQMAALAPRVAYALQEADLSREERAELRDTMNGSLETMNSAAWRRLARVVGVEPNALAPENVDWIADYLELPGEPGVRQTLQRALREGIPHQVLNAKEHTREAGIIARAGEPGAITIATNMAGRGVDIKLGGELSDEVIHKAHQVLRSRGLDPFGATPAQMDSAIAEVSPHYARRRDQVLAVGGLHVLGTERHEARRIDNQLRGRSGRQGEPGSSRFYISLEDELMRRFGRKEMLSKLMEQIGDDFPIEHNLVSKTIERAQTSVEGYNFDIRKHLLEYDDVLNRQRETIYEGRLRILKSDNLQADVWRMLEAQVDEYLEKYAQGSEQQRLLFAGLDDVVPLIRPEVEWAWKDRKGNYRGPLTFGGHLTAFPPFTLSFLADQWAGQPLATVQQLLVDLTRRAAGGFGEQIRHTVTEIGQAVRDKYEERLDHVRALLDEKIEDFAQLVEERGQPFDVRRLAQHLERTYPFKLTMPRDLAGFELDDLREHWLAEVEIQFHRQTCVGLMDRVQNRVPADIRLDRVHPAKVPSSRLVEEMARVVELARKQAGDDHLLEPLSPGTEPTPAQVSDLVAAIKGSSAIDFGRLDRLVGHVLGARLDDLLAQYQDAAGQDQGHLRRELERLREAVAEGKKGGRSDLAGILRQLNELVHLDISTVEELLSLAVAHEYDKWAQRQLAEIEADASHNPLPDTTWTAIAEHLLATHYTQKQVYDRSHQRHMAWMPRLPFSFMGQAFIEGMEAEVVRDKILASLRWAVEQREQVWGQQELQFAGDLSLDDLDDETYHDLIRYLGRRELGERGFEAEQSVEELPPELYDRLRFILALRELEKKSLRVGDLPQADEVLERLGQGLEGRILDTPIGQLDDELRERIGSHLRQAGFLDDPAARARFRETPIRDWDQRTYDQVAALLGQQFIEAHKAQPIASLASPAREMVMAHLQRRRAFVDEERMQRFLVHQHVSDLPLETRQAALLHLSRSRLDRISRKKISNLDVSMRQGVIDSLQRMGLFTDESRRDGLLAASASLADLEPGVRNGFGVFLAHQRMDDQGLGNLDEETRQHVVQRLKRAAALASAERVKELAQRRLGELNGTIAAQVRGELVRQLRTTLATKTMEELPDATRRQIHQLLDERNYFVDSEQVSWYERKTLAQLPAEVLRGLEQHLGQVQLARLAAIPFRDLPPETRESLRAFFDAEGLLSDRAARLRLTQAGSLAELSNEIRDQVARHLGRQWLVRIRDRRPPDLPDDERQHVWVYLRDQGYFADAFKEELFAYQRLDEFDPPTRQAIETSLIDRLTFTLESQPIGGFPPDLQAEIREWLSRADYFVDEDRLRQVQEQPVQHLAPDLRQALDTALGDTLLTGLVTVPVADLPAETQAALWRYLDEIGYFVDDKKRSLVLDRRLADLSSELYEAVLSDLALHLEQEIGHSAVSELDDDLRQGLREALEALGYFESDEARAQIASQPLGALRREDLDALAAEFGRESLESWSAQRLDDLPQAVQEAILSDLQARDWFLDRGRLDSLQSQRLRDLAGDLRQDLVEALRRGQGAELREQPLSALGREQRRVLHQVLQEQGLALDEDDMRPFRRQRVSELDQDVYSTLLQDLGSQILAGWGVARFRDLNADQQALLSGYLGRRMMARIEQRVLLYTISRLWIDYLTDIEEKRRGIGLEAYGQRDPLVEYKRQAFEMFEELGDNIRREAVRALFRQPPEPLITQ